MLPNIYYQIQIMTKNQLREVIRHLIKKELKEEMKTKIVPNPNVGKWRIVNEKTGNPMTKEFYNSKEEAMNAVRALGRTNAPGVKIVQLKDTMAVYTKELNEDTWEPEVEPDIDTDTETEEDDDYTFNPEEPGSLPKPGPKASAKEMSAIDKLVKMYKDEKANLNEAGKTWAEGYEEGYNEGFKASAQGKPNKFKK